MKKLRIRKFDYIIWGILLILGILVYTTNNSIFVLLAFPFLLLYGGIWILRLLLFFLGQTKQISSSETPNRQVDTSSWIKCRGLILEVLPGDEIVENGKVIAKLIDFVIKLEEYGDISMIHNTYVKGFKMPISHFGSFAINTQVTVFVNPKHQLTDAVFDPYQKA